MLETIRSGWIKSAHDVGDGGLAVALAESCLQGKLGASVTLDTDLRSDSLLFGESQTRFLLSVNEANLDKVINQAANRGSEDAVIGRVTQETGITIHKNELKLVDVSLDDCSDAFNNAFELLMKADV